MSVAVAPVAERPAPLPEPPPRQRRRRVDVRVLAGLGALLTAAAALRLEGIGTWYWIDEALSVGIARHDLVDIPGLLLRDGSPPLWYLLLHGWTAVFGTSVVATHAMSLVFGLLAVPVSWLVGRRLFGHRAGWMAAGLATISPFVIYFSRETRMYSLVVVLGLLVAMTFVEAFVDGRRRAHWWFAASLVLLLYTHNWGLYTGVACAAALVPIWIGSDDRRGLLRRALAAFGVVAAAYLPWVPSLLSQVENTGAPWSYTPSLRDVIRELAALFRDERVLVGIALATFIGLSPLLRRRQTRDALAVTCLGILVVVPVLIGWGLAHVEPSWATRYLAVIVGPLVLVLGVGLARAGGIGVAALGLATLLIVQPITRLDGFPLPLDAKSNGREVAAELSARLDRDDLVIVIQPEAVPLLRSELGPGFRYADPTGVVADPTIMDWRDAEDRLRAASYARDIRPLVDGLRPGERLLVVAPGNAARSTDTAWIRLIRAQGRRIVQGLRADRRLVLVDRLRGEESSYVTLDAAVYERVTTSAS